MAKRPRASLTNTQTNERLECQFNPASFVERIAAAYSQDQILFGTRQVTHWGGTASSEIPLELYFAITGVPAIEQGVPPGRFTEKTEGLGRAPQIAEQFLKACMYPDRERGFSDPPDVIFEWPNTIRIFVRILSVEFEYTDIDQRFGLPNTLKATVMLREVPRARIRSGEVRTKGSRRAALESTAPEMSASRTEARRSFRDSVSTSEFGG
jgi:hypothetical protein